MTSQTSKFEPFFWGASEDGEAFYSTHCLDTKPVLRTILPELIKIVGSVTSSQPSACLSLTFLTNNPVVCTEYRLIFMYTWTIMKRYSKSIAHHLITIICNFLCIGCLNMFNLNSSSFWLKTLAYCTIKSDLFGKHWLDLQKAYVTLATITGTTIPVSYVQFKSL